MTIVAQVDSGIGSPVSRIDGPDKVTGRARYAAEHAAEGLVYGWIVSSAIAKGRVTRIDETAAAWRAAGVTVFQVIWPGWQGLSAAAGSQITYAALRDARRESPA